MAVGPPLQCKNCGARLTWDGHAPVVECEYCHARLPMAVGARPAVAPSRRSPLPALAVGAVLVGAVVVFSLTRRQAPPPPPAAVVVVPDAAPPPPPDAAPPPLARKIATIGQPGTGAGQLSDARHLAVSPAGVFVAEYSTGRVQEFAADGALVGQITLPPSPLTRSLNVFGLAADAARLYVARDGDVLVYAAADRALVRTVRGSYPETWYHGDVAVDSGGRIYALTDRTGRLDLVILSPEGKPLARRQNVDGRHLAVDGIGAVVLARGDSIDVVDAEGELEVRFAAARPGPLAVDGAGHVFVGLGSDVVVFDRKGREQGRIAVGSLRDLAVHDGRLFVLGGDQVTTYALALP